MAQDANAHLNGTGSDGDGNSEVAESGPDDDNELDDEEDEELDDDYMQQLAKEARRLKVADHMAFLCVVFVCCPQLADQACTNQDASMKSLSRSNVLAVPQISHATVH